MCLPYIFWLFVMTEKEYQAELAKRIQKRFKGAIVLKNDSSRKQGIPDLTVLYRSHWAALECKQHKNATHRPNQDYYISKMDEMSFARFIYPENEKEVLDEMDEAFTLRRSTRISKRE